MDTLVLRPQKKGLVIILMLLFLAIWGGVGTYFVVDTVRAGKDDWYLSVIFLAIGVVISVVNLVLFLRARVVLDRDNLRIVTYSAHRGPNGSNTQVVPLAALVSVQPRCQMMMNRRMQGLCFTLQDGMTVMVDLSTYGEAQMQQLIDGLSFRLPSLQVLPEAPYYATASTSHADTHEGGDPDVRP